MAIQRDRLFSGVAGPVVFFTYNGKQGFRARPKRVKQTKGMKSNASRFGKAAAISSSLRWGLLDKILADPKEKSMRYRLDHTIAKWLRHNDPASTGTVTGFVSIEPFQFNEKAPLPEKWNQLPVVDWDKPGTIEVHIPSLVPARDIAAPPGTKTICWKIAAVQCEMKRDTHSLTDAVVTETEMKYDQKESRAQTVSLALAAEDKHLTIVVLALKYKKAGEEEVEDENWMPAAIIATNYRR